MIICIETPELMFKFFYEWLPVRGQFFALGIFGVLVGVQFVLPGASHARLPGASTLGQMPPEIQKHRNAQSSTFS